nr:hypothetical protein [Lichenicola cladoniae]
MLQKQPAFLVALHGDPENLAWMPLAVALYNLSAEQHPDEVSFLVAHTANKRNRRISSGRYVIESDGDGIKIIGMNHRQRGFGCFRNGLAGSADEPVDLLTETQSVIGTSPFPEPCARQCNQGAYSLYVYLFGIKIKGTVVGIGGLDIHNLPVRGASPFSVLPVVNAALVRTRPLSHTMG